jgi:hypothetical protein
MVFPFVFFLLVICLVFDSFVESKSVVELQSLNFELTVTSYQYLAILFYDSSDSGLQQKASWVESVSLIDSICDDCEIAMVNILYLHISFIFIIMSSYYYNYTIYTCSDKWFGSRFERSS